LAASSPGDLAAGRRAVRICHGPEGARRHPGAAGGARPPGPNGFGRVILETPDAKALGQLLAGRGAPMREVVPGVAYFITDPEGNAIELYTPPRP